MSYESKISHVAIALQPDVAEMANGVQKSELERTPLAALSQDSDSTIQPRPHPPSPFMPKDNTDVLPSDRECVCQAAKLWRTDIRDSTDILQEQ